MIHSDFSNTNSSAHNPAMNTAPDTTISSTDNYLVRVGAIRQVAPTIREFTLNPVNAPLTPFSPGAHVVVTMKGVNDQGQPKQWKNAYSLLSDPRDPSCYRIAVRLQEQSRGGSVYMHQRVEEGDILEISPPANLFAPNWRARKHLLIAGGVGITPFLSYLPELQRLGADFELHYAFRGLQTGAYQAELAGQLGEQVRCYDADAGDRLQLSELLKAQPRGTHVYVCGPELLIDGVRQNAALLGYPDSLIHFEEFAAPQPGLPFTVTLGSSGTRLEVGPDESLLEVLEANGIDIPNQCRGGVCGQCMTPVQEGEVEHRDAFLDESERKTCMMPCVSRAKSATLVLGL